MSTDKEKQIVSLTRIFADASFSPVFRPNQKYAIGGVPRIAFSDVMERRYAIRVDTDFESGASFWDEKSPVVVEYKSIAELVEDGWRLD